MPEIVSRREARIRGLSRFYTGQLCAGGHIAERLTSSGVCVVCSLEWKRRWRKANPEKVREQDRRRRMSNREKRREAVRLYRLANPEKVREQARRYREANPEKIREYAHAWRAANPEKARECARRYREAKRAAKADVRAQE